MITVDPLDELPGLRHAFFTREGGVSGGIYASLNCGFGSKDDPTAVAENRTRALGMLDRPVDALATVHQIHSDRAVTVDASPEQGAALPKADALVTDRPGVVLGILTADCSPVLFVDPLARVIGAAHAGWRGARDGILETTIAAMGALGATASNTMAAIGPTIGPRSYEVGPEFPDHFRHVTADSGRFFAPAARSGHFMFDLPAYIAERLRSAGIAQVVDVGADTCGEERRFFSYRRNCLRGETDYGRGLSAILLTD